jgi:hypothetical protein
VDSSCVSNEKTGQNKVVKTAKIFFSDMAKKEVSITVFYN